MIKTEQLYDLVQVAKYHSITLAAKEMYLTKAAVSTAIKQLEKECGFEILERTYRGVKFTPKGERVLEYARVITQMLDEIPNVTAIETEGQPRQYELYVEKGLMSLLQTKLLNPSKGIMEAYKLHEIDCFEDVKKELNQDNLAVVIFDGEDLRHSTDELKVELLYSSRYYPVSSRRTRWIDNNTNCITLSEYEKLPKIVMGDRKQKMAKAGGNIVLQTENANVFVNAILNDLGIGLTTDFAGELFIENRKLLKMYPPIDNAVLHIALVMYNGGDLSRAELLKKALL